MAEDGPLGAAETAKGSSRTAMAQAEIQPWRIGAFIKVSLWMESGPEASGPQSKTLRAGATSTCVLAAAFGVRQSSGAFCCAWGKKRLAVRLALISSRS